MRRIVIGAWLLLCTLTAGAEEPSSVLLFDGGFAPSGANFQVTFGFSDMTAVSKSVVGRRSLSVPAPAESVLAWSNAEGAAARLEVCCVQHSMGLSDATLAAAHLRITNPTDHPFKTSVAVTIAPSGSIHALAFEQHAFLIEGHVVLVSDTPSRGAILAESPFAPRPLTRTGRRACRIGERRMPREMLFDLALAPGQTQVLGFVCPVRLSKGTEPKIDFYRTLSVEELFAQAEKEGAGK